MFTIHNRITFDMKGLRNTSMNMMFFVFLIFGIVSPGLTQDNCWIQKTDMPTKRFGHSAIAWEGKIYVFGGSDTREGPAFNKLEVYDPQLDSWTTKTNMPTARATLVTCIFNDKIYTIGGGQSVFWDPTDIIEVYDPVNDTWDTTEIVMPRPRMGLTANVVDGKIYIIGGADANEISYSEVDIYDPATDTWTTGMDFPLPRFNLASAVLNDRIFAMGGHTGPPWNGYYTVDEYNPATDSWVQKTNMLTPRKYFTASALNSRIYVFGGSTGHTTGDDYIAEVEEYKPETDSWIKKTNIPLKLVGASSATVNDKIYIIGGTTQRPPEDHLVSSVYEYTPHYDLINYVKSVQIDKRYATPGIDQVLIKAGLNDPAGITLNANIIADDYTLIDSVELYDDGIHSDGVAGDSLFANSWSVPPTAEKNYYIHLNVMRTDTDTVLYEMPDMLLFTTIGPLSVSDNPYIEGTYTARYRTQNLQVVLKNNGITQPATNLSIQLNTDDIRINPLWVSVNVEDIIAGAEQISNMITIQFAEGYNPDSTINNPIHFDVLISSSGNHYWTSSFEFAKEDPNRVDSEICNQPDKFALYQNYPNPFNPVTVIHWQLAVGSQVDLSIHNMLGQKVTTLVSEKQPAGHHQVQWDASALASGVYYYQLRTDAGFIKTKKLLFIK